MRINKFLCLLVFMLSIFSGYAQSYDSREEMRTLLHRVDSLEHELSYLKLSYELDKLNLDIGRLANDVHIYAMDIQLALYNRYFDSELYNSYQGQYDAYQVSKVALAGKIASVKMLYNVKIVVYPYTENELNVLKSSYNLIDSAYSVLERSMNLLKTAIVEYGNLCE